MFLVKQSARSHHARAARRSHLIDPSYVLVPWPGYIRLDWRRSHCHLILATKPCQAKAIKSEKEQGAMGKGQWAMGNGRESKRERESVSESVSESVV